MCYLPDYVLSSSQKLTFRLRIATKCRLLVPLNVSVTNGVDPHQTAPLGAVSYGSTLFVCMSKLVTSVSICIQ